MLEYVVAQGRWLGPQDEITALTAVAPLPTRARGCMDEAQAQAYYEEEAAVALQPVLEFATRHQWKPAIVHRVGLPGQVISKMASDEGFDLVLMGSHGHSALGALLLGSVTTQVLAQTTVPVLIVRR